MSCKAINQPESINCWNCEKDRAISDAALVTKEAANAAELEARRAAAQVRQDAAQHVMVQGQQGRLDFRQVFAPHAGTNIGMNVKDPSRFDGVVLVSVQVDHFVVSSEDLLVRTPYSQILRVTEAAGTGGVKATTFGRPYSVIVEVFHLVVYKGAVGLSIPI